MSHFETCNVLNVTLVDLNVNKIPIQGTTVAGLSMEISSDPLYNDRKDYGVLQLGNRVEIRKTR
jgi:hypothetical protein